MGNNSVFYCNFGGGFAFVGAAKLRYDMKILRGFLLLTALGAVMAGRAQTPATAEADTLSMPGYELGELVIEGEIPVVQTDGATLTYNVDEDPASKSSTALDMMRRVPMVSVDADGNILLNGSGAFKLQLNGVENPMLKQNAGVIMAAMPASMISKIEVITEPGAKEDAEGVAGVINIITERTAKQDGAGGSVGISVSNRTVTPTLYAIMKKNKVTFSANLNYDWSFAPQKSGDNTTMIYEGATPSERRTLLSEMQQEVKHQYVGGNIDMSWEPNPANLFTVGANVFYIGARVPELSGKYSMLDASGKPTFAYAEPGDGSLKVATISANASYRHNFSDKKNYLVFSYLFNYGKTDLWLNRWFGESFNYFPTYDFTEQSSVSFNRGHTFQADYANDFGSEKHLLEVGAKAVLRHNGANSDYRYYLDKGMAPDVPDSFESIAQPQDIYAAYGSYTGKFGKFGVTGGLRYEHTRFGITNRVGNTGSFINRLNDVVPNLALTWNRNQMSSLRLAYQMRITRPSIEQVNPFPLTFSQFEVREGNRYLKSERNHIVSLKYSAFGRVTGGSIGVEFKANNNAISNYTFIRQTSSGETVVVSFANIGKEYQASLTGFFTWSIIKNMRLNINGSLSHVNLKAPGYEYSNHGWDGYIGGDWQYTIAEVYRLSAYGSWSARDINLQGYNPAFYYYGISATRDFLADRSLTLGISAANFCSTKMKFKSHTHTPGVDITSVAFNRSFWKVALSLTWKFGTLNNQIKKTGVEILNDDISSASNKSQGGI